MIRIATLLLLAGFATSASAQFSNPFAKKAPEAAGGEPVAAVPANAIAQDALMQRFIGAQSRSMQAQTAFARAFGLADQVQLLEAEQLALSSGSVDVKGVNRTTSVTTDAQAAIDAKQAGEPALSEESKVHYAQGLAALLLAVNETRLLVTDAAAFANNLRSGNPLQIAMMARKLMVGAWIVKATPGHAKNLYSSTKSAFTFAKRAKIKTPPDADSMLDSLAAR